MKIGEEVNKLEVVLEENDDTALNSEREVDRRSVSSENSQETNLTETGIP